MFYLSDRSETRLDRVHADLVRVVQRAITITEIDFGAQEGVRSIATEKLNIAHGVSHLKDPADCLHCIQADGFGHAVDLVPYIDGQPKWLWPAVYAMAEAVHTAALLETVTLRWGGCWDRVFNELASGTDAIKAAHLDYAARHPGALLDGVHFELAA